MGGDREGGASRRPDLRLEQASNYVLKLERLISSLASECTHLGSAELDDGIDRALQLLGEFVNADRAYLFQLREPGGVLEHSHEWCASGIEPRLGRAEGLSLSGLPWFATRLRRGEAVKVEDVSELPDEAGAERMVLEDWGVQTLLTVPLYLGTRTLGFIGFHAVRCQRQWEDDVVALLGLMAESLANALERRRIQLQLDASERRFELAMLGAQDGYWDWDVIEDTVYYSPKFCELLGYQEDELSGAIDWRSMLHPDEEREIIEQLSAHLHGESDVLQVDHRMRRQDGEYLWVSNRTKAIREGDELRRVIGTVVDISERRRAESALERERVRADITLQSLDDGVIITDASERVRYMNPAAEALLNWAAEEAEGRSISEVLALVREDTEEVISDPVRTCLLEEQVVRVRDPAAIRLTEGGFLAVEIVASPLRDTGSHAFGAVAVVRDVTITRRLTRRLAYQASHDMLTGLINRREFEVRLRRAMRTAHRSHQHHMLLYFDLDQFKVINDTCGHAAGDALLGQLGQMLRERVRDTDSVGRLGGDEFGMLLEDCSRDEGRRLAEDLRSLIEHFSFVWDNHSYKLGVSVGMVPVDGIFENVSHLLSIADSACYAAKEAGRNRIYEYTEGDEELEHRRGQMRWVNRINHALENTRLEFYKQTIMPLSDSAEDEGEHFELLLRMRDEDDQLIRPDVFIAAAERYGVMGRLDRWVVSNALRWLEANDHDGLSMMSVNLSGQSLGDVHFLQFAINMLVKYEVPREKVCFEVTETSAIANLTHASRFIHTIKGMGCRFALDDFGTGMSSFGYLKQLPVDFLKIDGSFVKDLVNDEVDREMVRSINQIGHITHKLTIAEYAEDEAIIEALRELGVDYAQGYGVARPEPLI